MDHCVAEGPTAFPTYDATQNRDELEDDVEPLNSSSGQLKHRPDQRLLVPAESRTASKTTDYADHPPSTSIDLSARLKNHHPRSQEVRADAEHNHPPRGIAVPNPVCSSMRVEEFQKKGVQFQWDTGSNHKDCGAEYPLKFPKAIKTTLRAIVYASKTDEASHGFADFVAVKYIKAGSAHLSEEAEKEMKNLKGLSHIHVIKYLGSFSWNNGTSLVMFPMAEWDLAKYMSRIVELQDQAEANRMKKTLRTFFPCLCGALDYIHREVKIKHRDIKPENILVDHFDNPLITDFGISTKYKQSEESTTHNGGQSMTIKYAAPEVLQIGGTHTLQIDIFSLGCVFVEMATVLHGYNLDELRSTVGNNQVLVTYGKSVEELKQWLFKLGKSGNDSYLLGQEQLGHIGRMLSEQRERPALLDLRQFFALPDKCCPCAEKAAHTQRGGRAVLETEGASSVSPYIDGMTEHSGAHSEIFRTVNSTPETNHIQCESDCNSDEAALQLCESGRETSNREHDEDLRIVNELPEPPSDEPAQPHSDSNSNNSDEEEAQPSVHSDIRGGPNIRVFSWKTPRIYVQQNTNGFGRQLLVYQTDTRTLTTRRSTEFDWEQPGIMIRLPRGDGFKFMVLRDQMNLWKQLTWRVNVSRVIGRTRYIFVTGHYENSRLLSTAWI